MDDQVNQGMPGGMPASPASPNRGEPLGGPGSVPPPPPPMGGPASPLGGPMGSEDPHEKIIAALTRIEEKLTVIAAKVGA